MTTARKPRPSDPILSREHRSNDRNGQSPPTMPWTQPSPSPRSSRNLEPTRWSLPINRTTTMGGLLSSGSSSSPEALEMALPKAKEIVASNPTVVFSKTYCPYCSRVKQLLTDLGATYKVVELDVESDGADVQAALKEWTGQRTVPNVFIKGNHIGGCDATTDLHRAGKLVPLLTEAGALHPVMA